MPFEEALIEIEVAAVIANFQRKGAGRAKGFLISLSFIFPMVATAVLANFLLWGQNRIPQMAAQVIIAGLYTLAVVGDALREAHESAVGSRWSAVGLLVGFGLFLIVARDLE